MLDLWRQLGGILQQETNSQGQAGPKGTGVACDNGPLNEGNSFIVPVPYLVKKKKSQLIPL